MNKGRLIRCQNRFKTKVDSQLLQIQNIVLARLKKLTASVYASLVYMFWNMVSNAHCPIKGTLIQPI